MEAEIVNIRWEAKKEPLMIALHCPKNSMAEPQAVEEATEVGLQACLF